MKNTLRSLCACAALLAAGCTSAPEAAFVATSEGVGPVRLGISAADLPAACDGLYDAIVTEEIDDDYEGDYTILRFTLGGRETLRAYPDVYNANRPLYSIEAVGPQIATAEGFGPGSRVAELFGAGARASMDNDGRMTVSLNGMTYTVDGLKEAGSMKLGQAYATGGDPKLGADDFERSAAVQSILIY